MKDLNSFTEYDKRRIREFALNLGASHKDADTILNWKTYEEPKKTLWDKGDCKTYPIHNVDGLEIGYFTEYWFNKEDVKSTIKEFILEARTKSGVVDLMEVAQEVFGKELVE